ncbi:MAG: apolipoprotein N-acyltransferase [Bacteroidales bacterium]
MLKKQKYLLLSVSSGLLAGLSWLQAGLSPLILISFVPVLLIMEGLIKSSDKKAKLKFYLYGFLAFLIWNIISVYWIINSTIAGGIAAIFISALIMSFALPIIFISRQKFGKTIGGLVFISVWISIEYFLSHSQLSWPWMTLGNAFADNTKLIQWYDTTGTFGGSFWILSVNYLIFNTISTQNSSSKNIYYLTTSLIIIIPIIISIYKFYTYDEPNSPVKITIIQPNVDPYNEKFNTSVSEQIKNLNKLLNTTDLNNPDYILLPETFIHSGVQINQLDNNIFIRDLRNIFSKYPSSEIIAGAVLLEIFSDASQAGCSSFQIQGSNKFYNLYNSALMFGHNSEIRVYHKIKLVPGAETVPYTKIFKFLNKLMLNLGGISGTHSTDSVQRVFKHSEKNIFTSTAICYESVFGEFISNFVKNGAEILFIITNDGWWGNTLGYRQHKNFARLRAIENRRSIARCANTGISCLINQKGQIIQETNWWKTEILNGQINTNQAITFYTKHGDYIAKFSVYTFFIFLIVSIIFKVKKCI